MKKFIPIIVFVVACGVGAWQLSHREADEVPQRDVVAEADSLLLTRPYSVMLKDATPLSGDKHDYMSVGPYWWPNPDTADGLPYVKRDGEINPERYKFSDRANIYGVTDAVEILGWAYEQTKDERYAARIEELIRIFFLDEATRMNPNLNYGQAVPGLHDGRGFGIIEINGLPKLFTALESIKDSASWDESIDEGLREWMREMLHWLTNNRLGRAERATLNNHGTYYDKLVISLYIYLGDEEGAKSHIRNFTLNRLRTQIERDGSLPLELARTKSWSYTTMNLKGFMSIATIAEPLGFDLWSYYNGDQIYIKSMIDWFIPYLKGEKEWTWQQIAPDDVAAMRPVLERAAEIYNDKSYLRLSRNLKPIHENIR